jgi:hypothetical protein
MPEMGLLTVAVAVLVPVYLYLVYEQFHEITKLVKRNYDEVDAARTI